MAYNNDSREINLDGISKKAEREFFDSLSGNLKNQEQFSVIQVLKVIDGTLLYTDRTYEKISPAVEKGNINVPATATVSHLKDMTFPGTPQINFEQYEQYSLSSRTPKPQNLFDAVRIAWHRNKHR